MAIEFILDAEEQRLKNELDKIANNLEHPEEKRRAFVLGQLTRLLIEASSKKAPEEKPRRILKLRPSILQQPRIVQREIPGIRRMEVSPTPYPGMPEPPAFKTIEIIEAPPFIETSIITPAGIEKKALILDRETNKPLAEAEVSKDSYNLIELPLTEQDVLVLAALEKKIGKNPVKVLSQPNKLTKLVGKFCRKNSVAFTPDNYRKLRYYLIKELINLGRIDPIFNDPRVTAISCDGVEQPLTVEYDGRLLKTNLHLKTTEEINHVIKQLGRKAGKTVSEKEPLLEAVIGDKKVTANYGTDWVPANFKIAKIK